MVHKVRARYGPRRKQLLLARRCLLPELCGAAQTNLESRALVRTSPPVDLKPSQAGGPGRAPGCG